MNSLWNHKSHGIKKISGANIIIMKRLLYFAKSSNIRTTAPVPDAKDKTASVASQKYRPRTLQSAIKTTSNAPPTGAIPPKENGL